MIYLWLLLFCHLFIHQLFFKKLLGPSKRYISNQLIYFFYKILSVSLITAFFCFIFPLNRVKFILLSLAVFLTVHFLEAIIVEKKIKG